jgi:hypothetical protein
MLRIALHCIHQIGDEIRPALQLCLNGAFRRTDTLVQNGEFVVGRNAPANDANNQKNHNNHYRENGHGTFFHNFVRPFSAASAAN